jgi:hypothetical protein
MLSLINPVERAEPFDHPGIVGEAARSTGPWSMPTAYYSKLARWHTVRNRGLTRADAGSLEQMTNRTHFLRTSSVAWLARPAKPLANSRSFGEHRECAT